MTARETFLSSGHAMKFGEMAKTEAFAAALDYALLALLEEQPLTFADPSKSWDYGSRMQGGIRALQLLRELHKPIKPPEVPKPKGLNYDALK